MTTPKSNTTISTKTKMKKIMTTTRPTQATSSTSPNNMMGRTSKK